MGDNTHCRIIICGLILWVADAQVTVMTLSHLNNEESFVCGTSETLICKTDPPASYITWKIDSFLAAECLNAICSSYLPNTSEYSFTDNAADGTFNMTKHFVRLSDNGTTFTCQDGSTLAFERAHIKVINDYESIDNRTSVHSTNSDKQVEFQVTTGCLDTATANNTTFKWFYNKANCREEYTNISSEQIAGIQNASDCVSDPDCGASGFTKTKSVLVITENEEGDACHIEVEIHFGSKLRTVKFMTAIKLKVSADVHGKCPGDWPLECIVSVIFSAVVLVSVLLFSLMIHFDIGNSTIRYYIGIICGVVLISTCIALVVVCCKKGSKEETDECIAGSSEETCGILDGCVAGIAITVVDSVLIVIDIFLLCYTESTAKSTAKSTEKKS